MSSLLLSFALVLSVPDTLSYRITFNSSQLTFSTIQGYDFVSMDDALFFATSGYPSLPRKALIFAIPSGSQVISVETEVIDSIQIVGNYYIFPAQPLALISSQDSTAFVPPDSAIYSLVSQWPGISATGSELGTMDLTELAGVQIYPVSWNPGTGELVLRETIDVRLILGTDSIPSPPTAIMTNTDWSRKLELLRGVVANPDSVESFSTQPTLVDENTKGPNHFPITVDYLIITQASWTNSWQPLVDWNIKRGVFTEVLTVEQIAAKAGILWAIGRDWPETIRNAIRWNHVNRGVQYILFATDTTPPVEGVYSTSEAPMRYSKLFRLYFPSTTSQHTTYTDWYYSCLDATYNWQTNSDSWWGEYYPPGSSNENDFMDLIPDVAIGRIPVHNATEARDAADNLVAYQRFNITGANPSGELLVVSAAVPFSDFPDNWEQMQEILSVVPSNITRRWVAELVYAIPDRIPINPDEVIRQLDGTAENSGFFRVSIGGHGGPAWIGANPSGDVGSNKVWSSDIRSMTGDDGNYCTGYAYNCLTGKFVNPDTGNVSIVETWLGCDNQLIRAPLGPGYIGNNAQGFNSSILGGSTSHKLNQWYLDALYNNIPSSGTWGNADAFNLASLEYASYYLPGYPPVIPPPIEVGGEEIAEPMWDMKVSNLGGDPALPIWLKDPMNWVSDYPSTLRCPGNLTISVETSGGVVIPGVRVCLMMEAANGYEIYKRGFTDLSGEYTAYLDPSFSGMLYVTLTKQGYLPDEGEVRLLVD